MINDPDDDEFDDPLNRLLADDFDPAPIPHGPGFLPTMGVVPEPIPPATPDTMVCLKGPCRHYMELQSMFQHGNSRGTLDDIPKQTNRFCRAIEGTDIDLTDELVFKCSEWDPLLRAETLIRDNRRSEWAAEQEPGNE